MRKVFLFLVIVLILSIVSSMIIGNNIEPVSIDNKIFFKKEVITKYLGQDSPKYIIDDTMIPSNLVSEDGNIIIPIMEK